MRLELGFALVVVVVAGVVFAEDGALTFAQAKEIWEQTKGRSEYQSYASEFAQFNNSFRLDQRGGCYALGKGAVELMLVIRHHPPEEFAKIDQVVANIDNEKARCFQRSYDGVPTKVPPFLPFVLQMTMG